MGNILFIGLYRVNTYIIEYTCIYIYIYIFVSPLEITNIPYTQGDRIHIYIYVYMYICIYVYMYIYHYIFDRTKYYANVSLGENKMHLN